MRATNTEALAIVCPHCSSPAGKRCVYPSGGSAKVHATRRWFAQHPAKPRPTPAPVQSHPRMAFGFRRPTSDRALSVRCPHCQAAPGKPCQRPSGEHTRHATRAAWAERQAAAPVPTPDEAVAAIRAAVVRNHARPEDRAALGVTCPACQKPPGERCVIASGPWAGNSARVHASRRLYAEAPDQPPPAPYPVPAKAVAAKRAYNEPGPRTRGTTAIPGMVSFRLKDWKRVSDGRAFVAVMASMDGAPARLVGVELAASECSEWGPKDVALRRAVERKVRGWDHASHSC